MQVRVGIKTLLLLLRKTFHYTQAHRGASSIWKQCSWHGQNSIMVQSLKAAPRTGLKQPDCLLHAEGIPPHSCLQLHPRDKVHSSTPSPSSCIIPMLPNTAGSITTLLYTAEIQTKHQSWLRHRPRISSLTPMEWKQKNQCFDRCSVKSFFRPLSLKKEMLLLLSPNSLYLTAVAEDDESTLHEKKHRN